MKKNTLKKVYVGMSGGVDSSVSAYLLKKNGYDVTGVFIKVWQPDNIECTWKEDRLDAMRVAAQLDIPLITIDLEEEYKKGVIDYMISDYAAGMTPNPDVMCNKFVKFGSFYEYAMNAGADYIATGHYTQNVFNKENKKYELRLSNDTEKDQGYFLWTITQSKLENILFPIGHFKKEEVRNIAKRSGLYTAEKKDSQGLCFIGKLDIKEFLKEYIEEKNGNVLSESGEIIGHHTGAAFLTIGERHGFTIDKKTDHDKPYFVCKKDFIKNTITVTDNKSFFDNKNFNVKIKETNWISDTPIVNKDYKVRFRHRGELYKAKCTLIENTTALFSIIEGETIASSGQSLVVFDGDILIGGGIITH